MKIWMLLDRYLPVVGGAEMQAAQLSTRLIERGHTVRVITRRLYADLPPNERINEIPVRRLSPVGLSHRANAFMLFRMLAYLLGHARQFDILHVHCVGPLGIAAIAAGTIVRKPVILKIATRGDLLRQEAGYSPSPYTRIIRKYVLPPALWYTILSRATAIITLSEEIVDEAEQAGLKHLTHMLPNGVETQVFYPLKLCKKRKLRRQLNLPESQPLILFSGRLVARKRVDVLLNALPYVLQQYPDCRVLLAGSGDLQNDSVEAELNELAKARGIKQQVTFLGQVDNIQSYLQAADVFAFPSEREGMPNAILEAIACGLPVVASHIDGITDIVSSKEAWLIPVGDPEAFATALIEVLSHPEQAEHKSTAARQRVEQAFSMTAVTDAYEELYKEALSRV